MPSDPLYAMVTQWSKVNKGYLLVPGIQMVHCGMQCVPFGPMLAICTEWYKVDNGYIVVQGRQWVHSGTR